MSDVLRTSRWQWYARGVRGLAALAFMFLVVAGVAKLLDLPAFAQNLATWSSMPSTLRGFALLGVPTAEVIIGLAWLAGPHRRAAAAFAILMLALVSIGLIWQVATGEPPNCGCLGVLARYWQGRSDAKWTLLRNVGLIGTISAWLVRSARTTRHGSFGPPRCRVHRAQHRPAFSLLELLLVIIILSLLVVLLAPGLSRARQTARLAGAQAQLRQHAAVFASYTTDFQEWWPAFTYPHATTSILYWSDQVIQIPYFGAYAHWPIAMSGYYDDQLNQRSFSPPGSSDFGPIAEYWYSASMLAAPEYWNPSTRTGPQQWGPTSSSQVVFPSAKGLLAYIPDGYPGGISVPGDFDRAPIAFCDGSADALHRRQVTDPYVHGEGRWQGSWFPSGIPIMHTIDGVRGRDRK